MITLRVYLFDCEESENETSHFITNIIVIRMTFDLHALPALKSGFTLRPEPYMPCTLTRREGHRGPPVCTCPTCRNGGRGIEGLQFVHALYMYVETGGKEHRQGGPPV